MTSISVVIPTHNREEFLRRALLSVARQTVPPKNIIVIDDASSSPISSEFIRRAVGDIPFQLLRNNESRGANVSRNIGIDHAEEDIIAFLDDDDEFDERKIEHLTELEWSSTDIVYHPSVVIYEKEGIRYVSSPRDKASFEELLLGNIIGGTSMVAVKRSKFIAVGGFDESLPALQDYEAWLRCAEAGLTFRFIPIALTKYYQLTNQKSISKSIERVSKALEIINNKNQISLDKLSRANRLDRDVWIETLWLHRYLLRGHGIIGARRAISKSIVLRSPKLLAAGVSAMFGLRFSLWVRLVTQRGR